MDLRVQKKIDDAKEVIRSRKWIFILYQMMFVVLTSNTTGLTCFSGTVRLYKAFDLTPGC